MECLRSRWAKHSPLEGESARRGRSPKLRRWGGAFVLWNHTPHRISPRIKRSASATIPPTWSELTLKGGVFFGSGAVRNSLPFWSEMTRSKRDSRTRRGGPLCPPVFGNRSQKLFWIVRQPYGVGCPQRLSLVRTGTGAGQVATCPYATPIN